MGFEELGSKIMIHKVTEYSKDVSSLQKSGEHTQANLAAKAAADTLRQQQQIQDIFETTHVEIQRDGRREKGNGREDSKRDKDKEKNLTKDEPRKIDIEI